MKQRKRGSGETSALADAVGSQTDEAAIARRAYELYLERGAEAGREVEDWLRAEDELRDSQR